MLFFNETLYVELSTKFAAGQQIQQDPNDPTKWQIVTTASNSPPISNTGNMNSPSQNIGTSEDPDNPTPKPRLRRVACTCPNCREGERYVNFQRFSIFLSYYFKTLGYLKFKN